MSATSMGETKLAPGGRIVLGYPSFLEESLAGDIAAVKALDPLLAVWVLVDSNLAGVYLRRRLAGLMGSHCRVRFVTFTDLAGELAPPPGSSGAPAAPMPLFAEEWLAELVAGTVEEGYFAPVARKPGFGRALLAVFRELREAGITELSAGGSDSPRLVELSRLYRQYRQHLAPFSDPLETLRIAAAAPALKEPAAVFSYGQYRLSLPERALLWALAGHVPVRVYWQECFARSPGGEECLARFQEKGFAVCRAPRSPEPAAAPDNLQRLRENLFQPAAPRQAAAQAAADDTLSFISAPDEGREIREIAREIISLARSGVPFHEMAVLAREARYRALLAETLPGLGIPCYLPAGIPLAQTRSGRSLLLYLDLVDSDLERTRVMDLVTYAPFRFAKLLNTAAPISPAYWDYLVLKAGVIKGRANWFIALDGLRQEMSAILKAAEDEGDPAAAFREEDYEPAPGAAREERDALRLLAEFLELLFSSLQRFTAIDTWTSFAAACSEVVSRFFHIAEETEPLLQLLRRLSRLDHCGAKVNFTAARELLRRALQETALPVGRFQQEGVNILPVAAAAAMRFTAVFVPGLVEKGFPAPAAPDPLLAEEERQAVSPYLRQRRRQLDFEALLFALAVNSAKQRLVLSWPRLSLESNRDYLPSFFITRAGEALLGRRPKLEELHCLPGFRRVASGDVPAESAAVSAAEYDQAVLARLAPAGAEAAYLSAAHPSLERVRQFDLSKTARRFTPYQGVFRPQGEACRLLAERLRGLFAAMSVTALEEYARCPYFYLLRRLLEVTPLEEPEDLQVLSPLRRGELAHAILEEFYRLAAKDGLMPFAGCEAEASLLLEETCCRHIKALTGERPVSYPLLWELEQHNLAASLRALLEWEAAAAERFRPRLLETVFGGGAGAGRVALPLEGGGEIRFRGRVDRIDIVTGGDGQPPARVRVIDYKTGRKRGGDDDLQGGAALQLPVYLLAAGSLLGLTDLSAVEACYYYLTPGGPEVVTFRGSPWVEKESLLRDVVSVLCRGLAAGQFFPYPLEDRQCKYCPYRPVCGSDVQWVFRCKADDPAVRPFLELKRRPAKQEVQ